jgi:hypothetical protein
MPATFARHWDRMGYDHGPRNAGPPSFGICRLPEMATLCGIILVIRN